jgi:hypothetical protein
MSRDPRSTVDDPTAERPADRTTQSEGGLTAGRLSAESDDRAAPPAPPADAAERNRMVEDDPVRRTADERDLDTTPRRYEHQTDDDPVMPSEDPSLGTKI